MLSLRVTITPATYGRLVSFPSPFLLHFPFPSHSSRHIRAPSPPLSPLPFLPGAARTSPAADAAAPFPPPEPHALPSPESRSPSSLGRRGLPHRRRRWIRLPRPPRAPPSPAAARSRLPWAAARSPAAAALDPALPGPLLARPPADPPP